MAKKRKSSGHLQPATRPGPVPVFDSPFRNLGKLLKARSNSDRLSGSKPAVSRTAALNAGPQSAASPTDDEALFHQALEGVRRTGRDGTTRVAIEPAIVRNIVSEDAEVLAELSDLVSGQGNFELTETDEYLEGARVGLDPRLVVRLRRGDFSVQAHIDLHGMTQVDAKEELARFILESVRKGRRSVLVVHGRGLRSPGGHAVLKHATAQWLSHGTIGGYVLAFTTARAYDGGTGAVWVLLRRERRRGKFDILQGARRRD